MYKILKTTYFFNDGREPFVDTFEIEVPHIGKYQKRLKDENPKVLSIEFTYQ